MSTVKKFYGHYLVDPYYVAVSNLFQIGWPQAKYSKALKTRIFIFTDLFHGYIIMATVL